MGNKRFMMWTGSNWLKVWGFVIIITIRGPLPWGISWINSWQHRICQQNPLTYLERNHSVHLAPRKYSWYPYLSEDKSTPGQYCGRKDYVYEKSNDTTRNRTRDLPVCTTDRKEKNDLMSIRLIDVTHKLQLLWQKKLANPSALFVVHNCPFLVTALQNHHLPFTVNTQFSHK